MPYLDLSDLKAFRLTCHQAYDQTLQKFGQRYLSACTTSLMGPSLQKLSALAGRKKLRRFLKTIYIQDGDSLPGELELWPRNTFDGVAAYMIGVEALRRLFLSQLLCPTTIEIHDVRTSLSSSDPEVSAKFAADILENSTLAVASVSVRRTSPQITIITLQLDAQHQGQCVGFSKLRSAELKLNYDFESEWATNVLYHSPFLEDLKLSFSQSSRKPPLSTLLPASHGDRMPRLKRMEFCSASLCTQGVITMLTNSRHSLSHLSFRLSSLAEGSTWQDLLIQISNEFSGLTSFSLKLLAQGGLGGGKVRFYGLDNCISDRYQSGLELVWKGRPDNRWVNGISYQGPQGSHVLNCAAACIVTHRQ